MGRCIHSRVMEDDPVSLSQMCRPLGPLPARLRAAGASPAPDPRDVYISISPQGHVLRPLYGPNVELPGLIA